MLNARPAPPEMTRVLTLRWLVLISGLLLFSTPLDAQRASERATERGAEPVVSGPLGQRADAWLSRLVPLGFSGAVLIGQGDQVLLCKGYGLSDRENSTPFSAHTLFSTGSITKQFTGAAILKLQEQGKLSTHDLLSVHLQGVPADKSTISLYRLLTHSAGFPGALGIDFDPIEREDFVQLALGSELLFPPGAQYEDSNPGYALLAVVVEHLSGVDYDTFVKQELLEPAGMTRSGFDLP